MDSDGRPARELLDRFGEGSERYRTVRERTLDALGDGDGAATAAFEGWRRAVLAAHGDVFAEIDPAPRSVFADLAYYDAVVDALLSALERVHDVEVRNRGVETAPADAVRADPVATRALAEDASLGAGSLAIDADALRALYEDVLDREVRLAFGEYYTPRGVVDVALDALAADPARATYLDPGCGSGAFTAACIERKRAALAGDATVGRITDAVVGIDLNPVAVRSARLTYLLALGDLLGERDTVAVPVYRGDALGLAPDRDVVDRVPTVDCIVGNPPWITWDRLPLTRKDRWRERYTDALDLFPHEGATARLGHGNDDLAVPFVWVCIHRYLAEDGEAAVVLKRGLTSGPAGRLLRSLRVGDRSLSLERVHDFGSLRPFGEQVGADAAVYAFRADRDPTFPVATTAWTRTDDRPAFRDGTAMARALATEETGLVPVDPSDPSSTWVRRDAERAALGACEHDIRHGLKDDAQAVFDVDEDLLDRIDCDLVYPYVKSRHVVPYGLVGHDRRLVPMRTAGTENEGWLRERYPETHRYLAENRDALEARSSSWLENGPFYTVFGLGEYTWAEYKVAWCRLGFKPHFAVVSTASDPQLGEKPVIPGDHYMFVATDDEREAHFLCALLNSAVYRRSLRETTDEGKASLTKTAVSRLALPAYPATERAQRLADCSREAHRVVADSGAGKRAYRERSPPELAAIQAKIDDLAESFLADS